MNVRIVDTRRHSFLANLRFHVVPKEGDFIWFRERWYVVQQRLIEPVDTNGDGGNISIAINP